MTTIITAERWLAEHGRFRRSIYAAELRAALGRVKLTCTWCGLTVPTGSRTWCSRRCSDAFMARTPTVASRLVEKRDRGVCAVCGRDTARMSRLDWQLRGLARQHAWAVEVRAALLLHWRSLGFNCGARSTGHLWEADHIVPVIEGGGCCGPENLRTACIPCHKVETQKLAARLAAKRKVGP